jgi:PST family polysaccharide transporter
LQKLVVKFPTSAIPANVMRVLRFGKARRKYAVATSGYLLERVIAMALSFAVYVAMARAYGPSGLGIFSYAQSLISLAAPLLAPGAEAIVIRELVRNNCPSDKVLGSALGMLCGSTIVAVMLPVTFAFIVDAQEPSLITMVILLGIGVSPSGLLVLEHFFKAKEEVGAVLRARLTTGVVLAAAKLSLIAAGFPIVAVVIVTSAESVVLVISLIFLYAASGRSILAWRFDKDETMFIFRQALPAMLSGIAVSLFFRINQILLANISTYDQLGNYSIAFQIVQLFSVIPTVIFSAIYPRMVAIHHDDEKYFDKLIAWLCYGMTLLGYACCLFILVFGSDMIRLIGGTKFHDANTILMILMFSTVVNFNAIVRGQYINIKNATKYHLISAAIGLFALVPASLALIPSYGGIGAAYGVAISSLFSGVVSSAFFSPLRKIGIVQLRSLFLIPPSMRFA